MLSFEATIAKTLAATGAFEEEAVAPLLRRRPTRPRNYSLPCRACSQNDAQAPKVIATGTRAEDSAPGRPRESGPVNGYLNFFVDRAHSRRRAQ